MSCSPLEATRPSILVLEDDDDLRDILSSVLTREGWHVEAAATGREALSMLERCLPDIMLIDLSMPDINGWALLDRRRREPSWAHIPAVAMSADHHLGEKALRHGANAFLPKPFKLIELRNTLRDLLDWRPAPP